MSRQGVKGALLDIYEQAILALKKTIEDIPDYELTTIKDTQTLDENCRSVQTILSHVVHSAYGYATSIHTVKISGISRPVKDFRFTINDYLEDLTRVFIYTENILQNFKDDELQELDNIHKIKTGWDQLYDIEQLMEHAIVHVLRHTRQIKQFKAGI
jgi:uncharacterized damage-inducible protein DinB